MKSFTLNFNGYWREAKKYSIPEFTGVYLAYRCVYNPQPKTVTLKDLVYIGQAENVKQRISDHFTKQDFKDCLKQGEELCYSVAEVSKADLNLVENALIFVQHPSQNTQGTRSFDYPDSSFNIGGRCALLKYTSFTISNP